MSFIPIITITRCLRKVMKLTSQTIYFNSKQQNAWFPLQSNPLNTNTLSHPSSLRFYVSKKIVAGRYLKCMQQSGLQKRIAL